MFLEGLDHYLLCVIYILIYVVCGMICASIAVHKNRNPILFIVLCVVLGIAFGSIGFFIALLIPAVSPKKSLLPEEIQGLKYNHRINDAYEKEMFDDGGWKCKFCSSLNSKKTGTCGCGKTREES